MGVGGAFCTSPLSAPHLSRQGKSLSCKQFPLANLKESPRGGGGGGDSWSNDVT